MLPPMQAAANAGAGGGQSSMWAVAAAFIPALYKFQVLLSPCDRLASLAASKPYRGEPAQGLSVRQARLIHTASKTDRSGVPVETVCGDLEVPPPCHTTAAAPTAVLMAPPAPASPPPELYFSAAGEAELRRQYDAALAALPAPHTERYVQTATFGRVHVLECGPAGAQPLVLWHGTACPGPFMLSSGFGFGGLTKRFRVIIPDIPLQCELMPQLGAVGGGTVTAEGCWLTRACSLAWQCRQLPQRCLAGCFVQMLEFTWPSVFPCSA